MVRRSSRLSKLILTEIILLFVLVALFTFGPALIEMDTVSNDLLVFLQPAIKILFVLIITWLFTTLLEPVFKRALLSYRSSYNVKNTWQFISYLIWISAFIILTFILIGNLLFMGIFIGIIFIIILVLSYSVIQNFIAWLHILFSNPIKKGDLIEVDGIKGRVSEVTTMKIVLDEKGDNTLVKGVYSGRKVSIPNSYIFSKPFYNISSSEALIWDEINVILLPNTDHLKAEDIMRDVASTIVGPIMSKRTNKMEKMFISSDDVPSGPVTEISIESFGVLVYLRYICKVSERSEVRSAISEGILKEFKKKGIRFTFKN